MLRDEFKLQVIECLYDDVGWAAHSVIGHFHGGKDLKEAMADAKSEFPKNRIRTRWYKPVENK